MITNSALSRDVTPFEYPIFYPNLFTPEECNKLVEFVKNDHNPDLNKAMSHAYDKQNVKAYFVNHTRPQLAGLMDRVARVAFEANTQYYDFEVSHFALTFILEFIKNSAFGRHIDVSKSVSGCPKISIVVFLSDKKNYEGGRLIWNHLDEDKMKEFKQEQGTMVMFPSYLCHEVEEVFSGMRHTLTTILCGNNMFR